MLRDGSRSTKCSAGHDGAASSGSSNSFSIQAENRFSVSRFQTPRKGQTLPATVPGRGGASARTAISRVTAPQPARVSVARQVPAAGDLTSASQKYGGPPWRSRERAATLPSGAISDKLAVGRLLGGEQHAQRRALPRHDRRRQHRELGRVVAGALGARVRWPRTASASNASGSTAVVAAANRRAANQWGHLGLPRPHRSGHAQALAQSPG